MGNMFRCTLASGGDGADLIVTCSSDFAGSVITCTDGSSYTKTQTCPSSSPYEVTFESIPTGTYTISGVVSGQTFTTTKTILDFDAELSVIPDGSTVTPTDNIQIWLHCANIWDKNYTTISQILADASTLQALIASNNAADYMARSTTWSTDVTADSSAMSYIGLDDYCADALLADSTWLTSICNSTYFENVLNVKVPTMTGYSTPSGVVTDNGYTNNNYGWKAFDGNTSTMWECAARTNVDVSYDFGNAIKAIKAYINYSYYKTRATWFKIEGSTDGNTWVELYYNNSLNTSSNIFDDSIIFSNISNYRYFKFSTALQSTANKVTLQELQIYGRALS